MVIFGLHWVILNEFTWMNNLLGHMAVIGHETNISR